MFPRTPDALKVRCRIADAAAAARGHHTRMDIILNGQSLPLPDHTTLAALLPAQHLAHRRVAVELHGDILPSPLQAEPLLSAGDQRSEQQQVRNERVRNGTTSS